MADNCWHLFFKVKTLLELPFEKIRVLLAGRAGEVIPRAIWLGNAVFPSEHPFWQ